MTNPTLISDLSGLLGRVEEATGADRELDHALFMMERGDWLLRHGFARSGGDSYWSDSPPVTGANRVAGPEPYTASLDASLALAERVLTGDGPHAVDLLEAAIREMCVRGWKPNQPLAPQLARAVIMELLRAPIAQGEARPADPLSRSGRK